MRRKYIGIIVCGPPGVGKSTHIQEILDDLELPSNIFSIVDPDKLELPHAEASKRAVELVHEHIKTPKNFVYIGTGAALRSIVNPMLSAMKKHNFKSVVCMVYTSPDTALRRIRERTEQPLPDDIAGDLYRYFKSKAEEYLKLPNLDELYLYNNEEQFTLVLQKKKKRITCMSEDAEYFFDISNYCST